MAKKFHLFYLWFCLQKYDIAKGLGSYNTEDIISSRKELVKRMIDTLIFVIIIIAITMFTIIIITYFYYHYYYQYHKNDHLFTVII